MTPVTAGCQQEVGGLGKLTINIALRADDGLVNNLGRPHEPGAVVQAEKARGERAAAHHRREHERVAVARLVRVRRTLALERQRHDGFDGGQVLGGRHGVEGAEAGCGRALGRGEGRFG